MKTLPPKSAKIGPLEVRTRALDLANSGPIVTAEVILWQDSDPATSDRLAYWLPKEERFLLILEDSVFLMIPENLLQSFWDMLKTGHDWVNNTPSGNDLHGKTHYS